MNQMTFIKDRLSGQRRASISARFISIIQRYGMSAHKLSGAIFQYAWLALQHKAVPTFPITASVLQKHAELIRQMQDYGARFAIHGYSHVDYTLLSPEKISEHFENAVKIFRQNDIEFSGFRFPYLKRNPALFEQLPQMGLAWDSSDAICRNPLKKTEFHPENWVAYQFMLDEYQASPMVTQTPLPKMKNGLVELPVTLPDDDLLVDRLQVQHPKIIEKCWCELLDHVYERGEMFVLQLHPERFFICASALKSVLQMAESLGQRVWLASLNDINEWWRERLSFRFEVRRIDNSKFDITAISSDRAAVLIKNGEKDSSEKPFIENYFTVKANHFELTSPVKPIIGISPALAPEVEEFLKAEGFASEVSEQQADYSVYLPAPNPNAALSQEDVKLAIEHSKYPLLRFWRWPERARCVLSLSGDIDCITFWDFYSRIWEN